LWTASFIGGLWGTDVAERAIRILVVEDASLVRLYYRSILEAAGYTVDEAFNGLEALEKVLENPPDLLIVDVNMPQMDGLTFLAALRKQPLPSSAIPALITSTEAGRKDMIAARAAGANYYLIKPLSDVVLVEHVAILCGGRE
jgi:two-component system, chemotaxis family, chemotaxis protein CheY